MKLIDTIRNVIYEQLEDYEDVEKLFGGDIESIFNYYRKNNQLEELVQLLNYQPLKLVPTLIETGDKKYEELAWRLVKPYLDGDIIREGDRYILSLNNREDVTELFKDNTGWGDSDCKHIAEMVFQEDAFDWEPYASNEGFEQLVDILTEENYQELVTSVIENYGNEEIKNARGEFDHWIEVDNLSDNPKAFILTPDRILGSSEDRYSFAALIDTPDLSDFTDVTERIYDKAYNDVMVGDYYTGYYQAVDDLLGEGKDKQRGSTTGYKRDSHEKITVPVYKYEFDVTNKFWEVIKIYAQKSGRMEIDEYGWLGTLQTIMYDYDYKGGLLCPKVDEYPDEDKVDKTFNDIFIEELRWNL